MTRADKFEQVFGYRLATDEIICSENDWCGENDACKYCICNPENIGKSEDWWNAEYEEPTTKNNLPQERYQDLIDYFGDKEVAKTILEDRKEFKAWLERLRWNVKRADELARELEQLKGTTKNDLGVDCISRAQAQTKLEMNASRYTIARERGGMGQVEWSDQLIKVSDAVDIIRDLPPVTPQESVKPMVEIDLYSVIKQKYIEREVLDKIRAEMIEMWKNEPCAIDSGCLDEVLQIIDKYKAESEGK